MCVRRAPVVDRLVVVDPVAAELAAVGVCPLPHLFIFARLGEGQRVAAAKPPFERWLDRDLVLVDLPPPVEDRLCKVDLEALRSCERVLLSPAYLWTELLEGGGLRLPKCWRIDHPGVLDLAHDAIAGLAAAAGGSPASRAGGGGALLRMVDLACDCCELAPAVRPRASALHARLMGLFRMSVAAALATSESRAQRNLMHDATAVHEYRGFP